MTGVQTCALPICFPVTIFFLNKMFTFVGVKTENMLLKVEKRWVIAFIITAIVAMVSLFWPTKLPDASSGVFLEENNLVVCGNFSFDYFIVFVLGECCEVWFRELFCSSALDPEI